ncbi:MAG: interleukin-like EMT inducer domain-containing protein [Chloroflexota bacterium]
MTIKPIPQPAPWVAPNSKLLARKVIWVDLCALAALFLLPWMVFWAFWAPNPDDRLIMIGDIIMQGYPSRVFVHRLFNLGEWPLWNPYQLGGMPLLADVQVAPFYLPNLLLDLRYWGQDIPYQAFERLVISHYALGAIFFYGYLRNLGLRPSAALVGAIAFEFNGFFIGHRGHYNMLGVAAWVPGVIVCLDQGWKVPQLRWSLFWATLGGLAFSQMIMAGHPQLALYSTLFILAYFGYRWQQTHVVWPDLLASQGWTRLKNPLVRVPFVFAISGLFAAGLSAVSILPTAELLGRSMRNESTFAFTSGYSLLPRNLINLLVPEFLNWSLTEFRIYAGILTLVLILVVWMVPQKGRSEQYFYTIVLVAAALIAMGGFTSLQGMLYRYVPGFSSIRVSARAFYFANFSMAVLAALGADVLFRALDEGEKARLSTLIRYLGWALVMATGVAILLYVVLARNYAVPPESFYSEDLFVEINPEDTFIFITQTANHYLLFVIFLAGSFLLLWMRHQDRLVGAGLICATLLLVTLDITTFAPRHDTVVADAETMSFTIQNFLVEILNAEWESPDQKQIIEQIINIPTTIRVDNNNEILPNNYSQVWGVPFSSGYNILNLAHRFDLQTQWPYLSPTQQWDLFNVGYILTLPENPEPPEVGAKLILTNSQGHLWERTQQPNYAYFSTQIRLARDLQTVNGLLSTFPNQSQIQPAISDDQDALRQILTTHWSQHFSPDLYVIGQTEKISPVSISVLSGGQEGYSAIIIDGKTVTPAQRGIVFAVIDAQTGGVLSSGGFDTFLSQRQSDLLATEINAAPSGSIVALATYDEGTTNLNQDAQDAFHQVGATETLLGQIGQAYGLIGVKGATPGTALEALDTNPIILDIGMGATGRQNQLDSSEQGTGAVANDSQVQITHSVYRPSQITLFVENDTAGLFAINEADYPGWKAYVNGEETPIFRANGLHRAVILSPSLAGRPHEVTFEFDPLSFRIGGTISLLTLIVGLIMVAVILFWQVRHQGIRVQRLHKTTDYTD